jgi:hypothetical protein
MFLSVINHHAKHAFLASAVGGEWSALRSDHCLRENSPEYPSDMRVDGTENRSGCGEFKTFLATARNRTQIPR